MAVRRGGKYLPHRGQQGAGGLSGCTRLRGPGLCPGAAGGEQPGRLPGGGASYGKDHCHAGPLFGGTEYRHAEVGQCPGAGNQADGQQGRLLGKGGGCPENRRDPAGHRPAGQGRGPELFPDGGGTVPGAEPQADAPGDGGGHRPGRPESPDSGCRQCHFSGGLPYRCQKNAPKRGRPGTNLGGSHRPGKNCGGHRKASGVPPVRGGHGGGHRLLQRRQKAAAPAGGLQGNPGAGPQQPGVPVRQTGHLL